MKIVFIAATLPPQLNGIGDYSALLARELSKNHRMSIWTAHNTPFAPLPNVEIEPVFRVGEARSFRALEAVARREKPDWIVLQYACFAFGKRGFNLELPRVLRRIARRGDARFALMMHEPFVRVTSFKNALMTTYQRWQLWSLGHSARAIFYSIEPWQLELQRYFKGRVNRHLPVFSNIPFHQIERETARRALGLDDADFALGVFGSAHQSRLTARICDAARAVENAGLRPVVLYIGPSGAATRAAIPEVRLLDQGALAADEISARFAAMDVYLAAFSDGVSTRRTSLMTALQHGVPVVGTSGYLTDDGWKRENGRALWLARVENGAEFGERVRELTSNKPQRSAMGRAGQQLYEREFAIEITARRIMETLENCE